MKKYDGSLRKLMYEIIDPLEAVLEGKMRALQQYKNKEAHEKRKDAAFMEEIGKSFPDDIILKNGQSGNRQRHYNVRCGAVKNHGVFVTTLQKIKTYAERKQPICPDCRKGLLNDAENEGKPMYYIFRNKLTKEEQPRSTEMGYLTVLCKKCRVRFEPTYSQAYGRYMSLIGRGKGEKNLYCSDKCKGLCETYGVNYEIHGDPRAKTTKKTEVWLKESVRKDILAADENRCAVCHEEGDLEVHHIHPRATHPELVNDPDNLITLCKSCHSAAHGQEGCGYGDLATKAREFEQSLII